MEELNVMTVNNVNNRMILILGVVALFFGVFPVSYLNDDGFGSFVKNECHDPRTGCPYEL
jgi:hypothetical protein